jgi:hypothetical protein
MSVSNERNAPPVDLRAVCYVDNDNGDDTKRRRLASLAAVGLRWPSSLAAVGLRRPSLAVVGCCGASLAAVGPC